MNMPLGGFNNYMGIVELHSLSKPKCSNCITRRLNKSGLDPISFHITYK